MRPSASEREAVDSLDVLIRATARAKRLASHLYVVAGARAEQDTSREAVEGIAEEEIGQASAIEALLPREPAPSPAPTPRGAPWARTESSWPTALMAAFAVDQAATGTLVALSQALDPDIARLAADLVAAEQDHQGFAVDAFRAITDVDPGLGRSLAVEMIAARDWVKEIYPRRRVLVSLVEAGLLRPEAPRAHDSFLANLGDRVQDALGVLGEL